MVNGMAVRGNWRVIHFLNPILGLAESSKTVALIVGRVWDTAAD